MSALKVRLARLEAGRAESDNCDICYLLMRCTLGETEASAYAAHRRHTLEELVFEVERKMAAERPLAHPIRDAGDQGTSLGVC